MSGRLYGLGVGPGDPELLTLKAVRLIAEADVIAYPAPADGTESMARAIAAPHIPAGKIEIVIETPMIPGRFPANDVYDRYAVDIAGHLRDGRNVAVLCEGDPFLYGSFMYLFGRLAADFESEVVPGVSSLGACAARAGQPLVSRNQVLAIVPAPLDEADLEARIAAVDAVAIMKVGRHLEKVRTVLARLGRLETAVYIERATLADEKIMPLSELDAARAPYFSMILVRRAEKADA
ncbi:precorrin-2 C(20)-methyltransferase [Thalassospiraceae bacterium LMO-JJ14]|nr:precorrin-2 C(20)-methyltransferase [Thalassospiraceae bacterium LMO-JJ14]